MVDRVEGGYGTVIKVAVVVALLAILLVQPAIWRKEGISRAVLGEAAFDPHAVSDVFDRVVCRRLVSDTAVPCRACPLLGIAAQSACGRIVDLHIEFRIVFDRLAGFRIEAFRPVEVIDVLGAFDEFSRSSDPENRRTRYGQND